MRKALLGAIMAALTILTLPAVTFAHVVVTPNQAGIGARVAFNVSVPNEKEVAVKSIKLDIPVGLKNVQPDVLAGWDITTTQDDNGNVTTVTWTGNIPVGQRADFAFRAQAPAKATELDWKAYQTYADGTIVHWDQPPATGNDKDEGDSAGPYSVTRTVNDLKDGATNTSNAGSSKANLAFVLSIAALALNIGSLFLRRK